MSIADRQLDRSVMSNLIRDYLLSTGDSDILTVAKQEVAEEMERRKILEEHAKHFSTRIINEKNRKPRFETYVSVNGKRKPLRRTTLPALEEAIISYYKKPPCKQEESCSVTVESLYKDWRKLRVATKSPSTVHKDDWVWARYYDSTDLAGADVGTLTAHEMTIWLMERVKSFGLSKKKFREMKSLLNSVLDYAVGRSVIGRNPAREIHGISSQLFQEKDRPKREDQIFERFDQKTVIQYCWNMFTKTSNYIYLGIILNFLMGVRVGELSAIKFSDIDVANRTLTLQRSEVAEKEDVDGRMKNHGTRVVPYLKKDHQSRPVPLSDTALNIIWLIRESYLQNGIETEWLIINKKCQRATKAAIGNTIRRMNEALGLPNKGNHAIRKTVITEMIQSMMFTQKEIQTYFGHEDFATTSKYYDFALNDVTKNAEKIDEALGTGEWVTLGNSLLAMRAAKTPYLCRIPKTC